MFIVQQSQLSVLLLKEIGLISVLNHGLHHSHAKGGILISDPLNVEFKLVLNSL